MPQPSKFACKSCNEQVKFDVPDMESAESFAAKVPCSRCGKVGCTYWGPA